MFALRRGLAGLVTMTAVARIEVDVRPRAALSTAGRPKKQVRRQGFAKTLVEGVAPGRYCFVKGCLAPPKKCRLVPTDRDTIRLLPVKKARALAGEGVFVRWCREHRYALADSKKKYVPKPKVAAPSAPTPGPTTRRRAEAVALSDTVNPEVVVPRPKAIKALVSQPEGRPDKRVTTATAGIAVSELRGIGSRGATNVVDRGQLVAFIDRGARATRRAAKDGSCKPGTRTKTPAAVFSGFVVPRAPTTSKISTFLRKVAPAGSTGLGPRHRRGACWRPRSSSTRS